MPPSVFSQLLREAQRAARNPAEGEDLFQTVWLAAAEAGRHDLTSVDNRRWFVGALRKRARFDARTAIRRRKREADSAVAGEAEEEGEIPAGFIEGLPPRLRTTALLILSGHSKREILWLLRINEPALRQRIADLRRRWRSGGGSGLTQLPGLIGPLAFGVIRQSLLTSARHPDTVLASHDPAGHLFVVTTSRKPGSRQLGSGINPAKE